MERIFTNGVKADKCAPGVAACCPPAQAQLVSEDPQPRPPSAAGPSVSGDVSQRESREQAMKSSWTKPPDGR